MYKPPYRKHEDYWLIELRLNHPRQLFNTIDPSPFHEKDLDDAAERYIVDAVGDFHRDEKLQLVIHLPAEFVNADIQLQMQNAIRNYFGWRAHESRRHLIHCLRDGRLAALLGLSFLVFCLLARTLATHYLEGFLGHVLDEGLLIIGWVALWRPIEVFLYDWWPMRRELLTHRRIENLNVQLRPIE